VGAAVLDNPTRRCLVLIPTILLFFLALVVLKVVDVATNMDGGEGLQGSSARLLVGHAPAPTILYCVASVLFLGLIRCSSVIWCASAQAFYQRAAGQELRKQTVRELLISSLVCDWACYCLVIAFTVLSHKLDSKEPYPQDGSSGYEMLLAIHMNLKGLAPIVAVFSDWRIATKFIQHQRAVAARTRGTTSSSGSKYRPGKASIHCFKNQWKCGNGSLAASCNCCICTRPAGGDQTYFD
jgi:hypothetical protein